MQFYNTATGHFVSENAFENNLEPSISYYTKYYNFDKIKIIFTLYERVVSNWCKINFIRYVYPISIVTERNFVCMLYCFFF